MMRKGVFIALMSCVCACHGTEFGNPFAETKSEETTISLRLLSSRADDVDVRGLSNAPVRIDDAWIRVSRISLLVGESCEDRQAERFDVSGPASFQLNGTESIVLRSQIPAQRYCAVEVVLSGSGESPSDAPEAFSDSSVVLHGRYADPSEHVEDPTFRLIQSEDIEIFLPIVSGGVALGAGEDGLLVGFDVVAWAAEAARSRLTTGILPARQIVEGGGVYIDPSRVGDFDETNPPDRIASGEVPPEFVDGVDVQSDDVLSDPERFPLSLFIQIEDVATPIRLRGSTVGTNENEFVIRADDGEYRVVLRINPLDARFSAESPTELEIGRLADNATWLSDSGACRVVVERVRVLAQSPTVPSSFLVSVEVRGTCDRALESTGSESPITLQNPFYARFNTTAENPNAF